MRVDDHRGQPARVGNCGAVVRETDDGHCVALAKFPFHQLAHGRIDFRRFVQRGPPVAGDLLQRRLVVDAKAVPAYFADEKAGGLQRIGRAVNGGGFDFRLAQREPQLRQMRHLFRLAAGRFKEYCCPDAPVNVPQRAAGVGVQRLGMSSIAGDVRHNGGVQLLLAQLPQQRGAEVRVVQRRGTQRNQRLVARLPELFPGRQRNPLRQHRQRAASLLELRHGAPLALKHRQGGRVERVTGFEAAAQKLPRLGIGGGAVHRRPLGGQTGVALKAPVGVGFGDLATHPRAAQTFKQTAAHHFADFRLVIGDEILRDPVHHFGDAFLPVLIPFGHLHLAAGQADDGYCMTGPGNGHRQVLQEGVEGFGHFAVPVEEVQRFVEQQQRRPVGGGEYPSQRLGAGRRGGGRAAQLGYARIAGQLPR